MAWQQHFIDDFNRANSTTVGNDWSQSLDNAQYSTYGVQNNTLYVRGQSGATYYSRAFSVQRATTVGYARAVQATVSSTPNLIDLYVGRRGAATLTSVNSGYGYRVNISQFNGSATIARINNGTSTSLASGTVTYGAGTVYRVEHDLDGSMRLYANGSLALTASDTTYMTASDTEVYGVGVVMTTSTVAARGIGAVDNFTIDEFQSGTTYTVTYDEQGGSVVPDYSGAGPFTTPASTRTGYRLDRWNTSADGTGTDYTVGGTYDLTADLTLYAIWIATYTVTVDEQGGSVVDDVTYDTFYPPLSYRELWILDSWNTSADGSGTRYDLAETYTLTANLTLYAQWRQRNKVGVYLGGTTGGTDGTLKVPGDSATLTIGNIDDTETFHLRCATGWSAIVTVPAPPHCEVSLDGTTYAASVTATVGATNVAITVKRTAPSAAMDTGLVTLPRIHAVLAKEVA